MECDVREYIPWEEGGFLGKPESATSGMTDKEIALSLGFTWPSLKVRLTVVSTTELFTLPEVN
jgi:hypothetical protein